MEKRSSIIAIPIYTRVYKWCWMHCQQFPVAIHIYRRRNYTPMYTHHIYKHTGISLVGPLGTNLSEILIAIYIFSFKKMHLKLSSGNWRSFCLGLNVLCIIWCRAQFHRCNQEVICFRFDNTCHSHKTYLLVQSKHGFDHYWSIFMFYFIFAHGITLKWITLFWTFISNRRRTHLFHQNPNTNACCNNISTLIMSGNTISYNR